MRKVWQIKVANGKRTQLMVSEKMPWMVMSFGYLSIIPIISVGVFGWRVFDATKNILAGSERIQTSCITSVTPPICTTSIAYPNFLHSAGFFTLSLVLVVVCWTLGRRHRAVWKDANGVVRLTWGERVFPITFRHFLPGTLGEFTVSLEKRFTVSPIVGTNVQRVRSAPDRWRLRAKAEGKKADLGSYESEQMAKGAVRIFNGDRVRESEKTDESGVWHYGRIN